MSALPPPTGQPPTNDPTPPPTPPKKPVSSRTWGIIAGVIVVMIVVGMAIPDSDEDDPTPPSRDEIAEQTWQSMSLTDRAAMCDGYDQLGESFTVRNLLDGTGGDERMAEALLDVIRDEC